MYDGELCCSFPSKNRGREEWRVDTNTEREPVSVALAGKFNKTYEQTNKFIYTKSIKSRIPKEKFDDGDGGGGGGEAKLRQATEKYHE